MNICWDLTPDWWNEEWWHSHCQISERNRDGRDAQAVGYIIEIILEDTAPGAKLTCTGTSFEVSFQIESEEAYLRAINDQRETYASEYEVEFKPLKSLEDWREHIVDRINWVCGPRPHGGVSVSPPSLRINTFSQFGQVELHVSGLQPDNGSFSVTSPRSRNDYDALKWVFETGAEMVDKVRPKSD